ncbi:MAG TPA: serine hydrolase domain-containing protein, partial [Robiginitalea sp.]|nr:serine hydrolase domain-containing protein [Robiginitalea sp.]
MKNKILVLLYFLLVLPSVFSQEIERQLLSEDTPTTTVAGNSFTAPADWYLYQKGNATFLEATEDGSRLVIVDLEAENDSIAIAMAWAVYKPIDYPVLTRNTQPDSDGWTRATSVAYQVSPNEKRGVYAGTLFANGKWTVWIYDMSNAVGEKRGAQVNQALGSLVPKGYNKESFAGKKAHKLDANKLQELTSFIDSTMAVTKVPGVGLGIIQDGELVFAGGFGVRELGKDDPVDAETLFLVASNTKGLTTLLLAKLVEEGRFNWDTPVIELMPSFKLGSASTTSQTLVEHLICACTGLPRKDMEWIMEFEGQTASDLMTFLSETQPTSEFGEL